MWPHLRQRVNGIISIGFLSAVFFFERVFSAQFIAFFFVFFMHSNGHQNLFNYVEMIYRNLNAKYALCSLLVSLLGLFVQAKKIERMSEYNDPWNALHGNSHSSRRAETILCFSSLLFSISLSRSLLFFPKPARAVHESHITMCFSDSSIVLFHCVILYKRIV